MYHSATKLTKKRTDYNSACGRHRHVM